MLRNISRTNFVAIPSTPFEISAYSCLLHVSENVGLLIKNDSRNKENLSPLFFQSNTTLQKYLLYDGKFYIALNLKNVTLYIYGTTP